MMSIDLNKKIVSENNIKTKILEILLSLSVCLCIFSQLPINKISNDLRSLGSALWFVSFFYTMFAFGRRIKLKVIFHVLPVLIFDFLIMVLQVFSGNNYLSSQLIYPIHLSVFIFLPIIR